MSESWRQAPEKGHLRLMQFVIWVALKLGRTMVAALLVPIVLYYTLTAGEARRHSRAFLERVLERKVTWRDLFKHFYTFALVATDRVHFLAGDLNQFEVTVEGLEILKKFGGKGALLVTSHIGSFDVMRVIAQQDKDVQLRILMDIKHNYTLVSLLNQLCPELAENMIDADAFGPNLALTLNNAIQSGQLIGIMGDRLRGYDSGMPFEFLGEDAYFPEQLWHLASIIEAPVIHCFGVYLGGNRYKIQFSLISENLGASRKERPGKIKQAASKYVSQLETITRSYPYNWFNFYAFWQKPSQSPNGATGLEQ